VKQYKGKVTIIALFSTTCENCKKTVAILNKAQADWSKRGLQIVGAAIDDNAKYLVDRFAQETHAAFPVGYLDHESVIRMTEAKPPIIVPALIFVDRTTTVRFQAMGSEPIFKGGTEAKAVLAIINSLLDFNPNAPPAPVKTMSMPAPKGSVK
jgi:hypothetical protein